MDRRAGDATVRVVAAERDGRADARLVLRTDRAARASATSRGGQRLVLLLTQLGGAIGHHPQPATDAVAPGATPAPRRGHQPVHRAAQLPDRRAGLARGFPAAVSIRGP